MPHSQSDQLTADSKNVGWILMSALVLLVGCSPGTPPTKYPKQRAGYDVDCLDGVEYWHNGWSLAPRYKPGMQEPERCTP